MPQFEQNSILFGLVGFILGVLIIFIWSKISVNGASKKAEKIILDANSKSETILKEAALEAKSVAYELKLNAEKEIKERKSEINDLEMKLFRREESIAYRDKALVEKEKLIDQKENQASLKLQELDKMETVLQAKTDEKIKELERVASMTTSEARTELLASVEQKISKEITSYIKEKEEEARSKAAEQSRNILALAIQRYSQEVANERTVSVVALSSEEMKGRIIGREGRNIRAIEQATGVDLIIDDTPEVITVSCFDPIRREIARQSLEILVKDGRIQPGRIEEIINKVKQEMDETIRKIGEDAIFQLGISKMDKELIYLIGRLKYRYSYGQNALQHSLEVAHLTGMMAAELGLNQNLARRAGLLHDIGKAIDFEMEGSHIELGAKVCRKHGENAIVINAIESHHGEKPCNHLISNLVIAADTLSAARPGARLESLENYIQRLEKLEGICNEFEGVDKSFAIQAGREVRVMVVPEKVDDLTCHKLAREIREKIENELSYPGQIKITVIREVRANELAR